MPRHFRLFPNGNVPLAVRPDMPLPSGPGEAIPQPPFNVSYGMPGEGGLGLASRGQPVAQPQPSMGLPQQPNTFQRVAGGIGDVFGEMAAGLRGQPSPLDARAAAAQTAAHQAALLGQGQQRIGLERERFGLDQQRFAQDARTQLYKEAEYTVKLMDDLDITDADTRRKVVRGLWTRLRTSGVDVPDLSETDLDGMARNPGAALALVDPTGAVTATMPATAQTALQKLIRANKFGEATAFVDRHLLAQGSEAVAALQAQNPDMPPSDVARRVGAEPRFASVRTKLPGYVAPKEPTALAPLKPSAALADHLLELYPSHPPGQPYSQAQLEAARAASEASKARLAAASRESIQSPSYWRDRINDPATPDVDRVRYRKNLADAITHEKDLAQLRAAASAAGRPLEVGTQNAIQLMRALQRQTANVRENYREDFVGKGPARGAPGVVAPVREFFGTMADEQVIFRNALRDARDMLLRARSGAQINEQEYKRLADLLPAETNEPGVFETKLRRFETEVEAMISDRLELGTTPRSQLSLPPTPPVTSRAPARGGRPAGGVAPPGPKPPTGQPSAPPPWATHYNAQTGEYGGYVNDKWQTGRTR